MQKTLNTQKLLFDLDYYMLIMQISKLENA